MQWDQDFILISNHYTIQHTITSLMPSFKEYNASHFKQKSIYYHEQIRSKIKNQYFRNKRKQFIVQSQPNLCMISNVQHLQSLLQQHRNSNVKLNFQQITSFIIQTTIQQLPIYVEQQIMQIILSNQYLSDSHALASLCNLVNRNKFHEELITEQFLNFVINNLIPANQNRNKKITSMNEEFVFVQNCELICYLLQSLKAKVKFQYSFIQLSKFYKDIQNSLSVYSPQYLRMISQFSTLSYLLPSERVIRQYLSMSIMEITNEKELYSIVNTLQNYLRLSKIQDQQLTLMYIKFIANRITQGEFPAKLKVQMINLFTSFVNSSSQKMFCTIFCDENTFKIFDCILVRAKFGSQYQKISSIVAMSCLIQKTNRQQIAQILDFYPSTLEVMINFLQIQNQNTILHVLYSLAHILQNIPKSSQTMYSLQILPKLIQLQQKQSNYIFEMVNIIYSTYFIEYAKM